MPGIKVLGSRVMMNEGLAVHLRDPRSQQGLQPSSLGYSKEDSRQTQYGGCGAQMLRPGPH